MATHSDRITSSSVTVIFFAEINKRVFVEDRRKSFVRTVTHNKGSFEKKMCDDNYVIVDLRNGTRSVGYQNFTAAIHGCREVSRGKYRGEMFPNDGDNKALAEKLRETFPKLIGYDDETLVASYQLWA